MALPLVLPSARLDMVVAIGMGIGLAYFSHSWRISVNSRIDGNDISSAVPVEIPAVTAETASAYTDLFSSSGASGATSPSNHPGPSHEILADETESQEILNLLYLIAEDQTKKTGYIHRGISCNTCGVTPIKGTRYHCTECVDVDLCESCERSKRHDQFHILVKIKVPIPIVKSPRWIRRSWRPLACINSNLTLFETLPYNILLYLYSNLRFSMDELNSMHNEFKQFVDVAVSHNSFVPYGISLPTFQRLISPWNPSCLFATQVACVYDRDNDGVVTFEDFLRVRALRNSDSPKGMLLLALQAFDISKSGITGGRGACDVLESYYSHYVETFTRTFEDNQLQKQIDDGALTSSKPLSTFFASLDVNDQAESYATYLFKDQSLVDAPSIVEEMEKNNNPRYRGSWGHEGEEDEVSPLIRALFGRQAGVDMVSINVDMLANGIGEVWGDETFKYGPRLFDSLSPALLSGKLSKMYLWLKVSVL